MNKANLICFPYAGGSKFSYNKYVGVAPGNLNIIPFELPGRGARFNENLMYDIQSVVEDIFKQIKNNLYDPYAIYGHSMGSLIGYLMTQRIIEEELPPPLHLFFSGGKAPCTLEDEPAAHLYEKEELREELRKMGGIPDRILDNDNLMQFLEPIVRADFQVIDSYRYLPPQQFDIPISLIIGTEENIDLRQVDLWQKETALPLMINYFKGDHFFIFDHAKEIMELIDSRLMKNITEAYPLLAMIG